MNWRTFDQGKMQDEKHFFVFVEGRIYFACINDGVISVYATHGDCIDSHRKLVTLKVVDFLKDYPDALWAHIHLPGGAK